MIGELVTGETISGRGIDREAQGKQIGWRIIGHYGDLMTLGDVASMSGGLLRSSSAPPELVT
jgi:hypothetical protein